MSSFFKSKTAQLTIMILSFLAVFVPYFIDVPAMTTFSTKLMTITAITSAFTLLLALYSQFRRGYTFIQKRKRG
jgi:hypothetical protein